jgi:hypothetical protein
MRIPNPLKWAKMFKKKVISKNLASFSDFELFVLFFAYNLFLDIFGDYFNKTKIRGFLIPILILVGKFVSLLILALFKTLSAYAQKRTFSDILQKIKNKN